MWQRRDFSAAMMGGMTAGAVSALGLGGAGAAHAQGGPREGTDYVVLGQRVPSEAHSGKIEVIEFFWVLTKRFSNSAIWVWSVDW